MSPRYLVDKSALARMVQGSVRARLAPIIEAGEATTCAIIDFEVLYSARNHAEHERVRARRALAYHPMPLSQAVFERAIDVQALLAKRGRHRLPIPDLIIAATAQLAGLTVLHYDADYDAIAAITAQPVEWVVPRGSVP